MPLYFCGLVAITQILTPVCVNPVKSTGTITLANGEFLDVRVHSWTNPERCIDQPAVNQIYLLDGKLSYSEETNSFIVEANRLTIVAEYPEAIPIRIVGTAIYSELLGSDTFLVYAQAFAASASVDRLKITAQFEPQQYSKFTQKLQPNREIFITGVLHSVVGVSMHLLASDFSFLARSPATVTPSPTQKKFSWPTKKKAEEQSNYPNPPTPVASPPEPAEVDDPEVCKQSASGNYRRGDRCNELTTPHTTTCYRHRKSRVFDSVVQPNAFDVNRSRPAALTTERLPSEHKLGSMNHICQHCSALHFIDERVTRSSIVNPQYSQCCRIGELRTIKPYSVHPVMQALLSRTDTVGSRFRNNIRKYNNVLAFSSFNAKYDHLLASGRQGAFCFKIQGTVYHQIADLDPTSNTFANIYLLDPNEQLTTRTSIFEDLDIQILRTLQDALRTNPFVTAFEHVRAQLHNIQNLTLRLLDSSSRTSNLPQAEEVAAIIEGDGSIDGYRRQLVLKHRANSQLYYVNDSHSYYDPLMYVLMFPTGEEGWSHRVLGSDNNQVDCTVNDFYRFHLFQRERIGIHSFGRLFHQYLVDMAVKMESQRLRFIQNNQDRFNQLNDHIILPSSFVGSPRYMQQCYQDAMAIVRAFGKPDLFITMTCNPEWSEIKSSLSPFERVTDRPDLCARVFRLKLRELIKTLQKDMVFGPVHAKVYTIEFQKRGLPHAHLLLFLATKPGEDFPIDDYVCAELPNSASYPDLHRKVLQFMVHGPCDAGRVSTCHQNGRCRRRYPKDFSESTISNNDGYPVYRRRQTAPTEYRNAFIDNRWVVPYNPYLLQKFNCHINVEICSTLRAIKYLFKYVFKGVDMASAAITNERNEIVSYVNGRYVSASEASWRLLNFPLHEETPSVCRLQIHLENQQVIVGGDDQSQEDRERLSRTTLTAWMELNQRDEFARSILYTDIPLYYRWNENSRSWTRRLTNQKSIGRIYFIHPDQHDLYHLRLLLHHRTGIKDFADLMHYNGIAYQSYKDVALAMGLCQNDREWILCMSEAANSIHSAGLRSLLATIMARCLPTDPINLWNAFYDELISDFVHHQSTNPEAEALHHLDQLLHNQGYSLADFEGFPNVEIVERQSPVDLAFAGISPTQLQQDLESQVRSLNNEQREIYEEILSELNNSNNEKRWFYIDGSGGTGKTYLYNTIILKLFLERKRAFVVSSSGISSLNLHGGRTAHSAFGIPINADETTRCKVTESTKKLIQEAPILIWDEAPMLSKFNFLSVDRLIREIMGEVDGHLRSIPFGGKLLVAGGDVKQVLPVVPHGSPSAILNATLFFSRLWNHFNIRKLIVNQRAASDPEYAAVLEQIGDGSYTSDDENNVTLPNSLHIDDHDIERLISFVYPTIENIETLEGCTILAMKNSDVSRINQMVLARVPGTPKTYHSVDSVADANLHSNSLFPTEFLNSQSLSGLPPHKLELKPGIPVMLLRNLDQSQGLCNGTILVVECLHPNSIQARIQKGKFRGNVHFIPRITLHSNGTDIPVKISRHQFPISLAFAMTVNKSQGQTLERVGLYLISPAFSHGQLYVAMSRVRTSISIRVLTNHDKQTKNIVFRSLLLRNE